MKANKITKTILIMALLGGHSWAEESKYSKDVAATEAARNRHVVQRDQTVSRLSDSDILNLRKMKMFHPELDINKALQSLKSGQKWAGESDLAKNVASNGDTLSDVANDGVSAETTKGNVPNDVASTEAARNRHVVKRDASVSGLSESVILNLRQMKLFHPEMDYDKALQSLISRHGWTDESDPSVNVALNQDALKDTEKDVASNEAAKCNLAKDISSTIAARNRYVGQLNHDVAGVSESAIFNLMQMKM